MRDGWTDERVALLKRLSDGGMSASEMAARLGGVTRSAVLGKLFRLGLCHARASIPRRLAAPPAPRPRIARAPPRPSPSRSPPRAIVSRDAAAVPGLEPPGRVADLLDLAPGLCCWPIGDPKAADFSFCGAARTTSPYCAIHAARAFTAVRARPGADEALLRFLARTC